MKKVKNEKRIAERHTVEFFVSIYKDNKLVSSKNVFKDISLTGCLVFIANDFKFKINDRVILHIEEERLMKEFNLILDPVQAEVKRFDDNSSLIVGFEFINMSEKNQKIINRMIENKFILKKFPKSWQLTR